VFDGVTRAVEDGVDLIEDGDSVGVGVGVDAGMVAGSLGAVGSDSPKANSTLHGDPLLNHDGLDSLGKKVTVVG
jgi:hypothetical protein